MKNWFIEFVLPELTGIPMAIVFASTAYSFSQDRIYSAFLGTVGENIGYYGFIIVRQFFRTNRKGGLFGSRHLVTLFLKDLSHLASIFGPAEVIDSLIFRPFFMYMMPVLLMSYSVGIVVAKVVADIFFLAVVIIASEVRKRANTFSRTQR